MGTAILKADSSVEDVDLAEDVYVMILLSKQAGPSRAAPHRVQGAGCRVQGAGRPTLASAHAAPLRPTAHTAPCPPQIATAHTAPLAGYRVQGAGCRVLGVGCRVQVTTAEPRCNNLKGFNDLQLNAQARS